MYSHSSHVICMLYVHLKCGKLVKQPGCLCLCACVYTRKLPKHCKYVYVSTAFFFFSYSYVQISGICYRIFYQKKKLPAYLLLNAIYKGHEKLLFKFISVRFNSIQVHEHRLSSTYFITSSILQISWARKPDSPNDCIGLTRTFRL